MQSKLDWRKGLHIRLVDAERKQGKSALITITSTKVT